MTAEARSSDLKGATHDDTARCDVLGASVAAVAHTHGRLNANLPTRQPSRRLRRPQSATIEATPADDNITEACVPLHVSPPVVASSHPHGPAHDDQHRVAHPRGRRTSRIAAGGAERLRLSALMRCGWPSGVVAALCASARCFIRKPLRSKTFEQCLMAMGLAGR